jgi:hypothetical protein
MAAWGYTPRSLDAPLEQWAVTARPVAAARRSAMARWQVTFPT